MQITLNVKRFSRHRYSTIPLPVSAQTRVASVSRNKIVLGGFCYFPNERWAQIEQFRPHILMGSSDNLQSLANLAEDGILDLSSVDTAILLATELGAPTITDIDRVVLWQCFGVPVYELLLSLDGKLIASECEAHVGWHLEPRVPRPSRLVESARIETARCACGRKEPRIVPEKQPQLVRPLAATA
jgi:hypothetical protein